MGVYRLSFTTGGLYFRECLKVAPLYLELGCWDSVRNISIEENLLQTNTRSSSVRTYREVSTRLQQFSNDEIELLVESSKQDQRYLLWLAICRQYKLIEEFAVEVIREKFLGMDLSLTHHDYNLFFNRKADWHPELDELSTSTKNKLRQVLFRMLGEADLISSGNQMIPAMLSPKVARAIFGTSNSQSVIYPISDADLGDLLL